ncbi:MAG: hypothetical protein AB7O91_10095 [Sphingomonas sp.]
MIARGFKPVAWVAAVAVPALGCYMLSLKVAAERADLAAIESRIQTAHRDIRTLQTELGTRGRLQQLEQWNADVLALSAPGAAQFVGQGVSLARFDTRQSGFDGQAADVRMASAETPQTASPVAVVPQQASLPQGQTAPRQADPLGAAPRRAALARTEPAPLPTVRRASLTTEIRPAARRTAAADARSADRPQDAAPARRAQAEARGGRGGALVSADTAAALRREARAERQRIRN